MNDSDRTACRFKFIMLLVALAREKRICHVRRFLPEYPRPISHSFPSRVHLIHSDYLFYGHPLIESTLTTAKTNGRHFAYSRKNCD
jgi:hypothetical protein